VDHKVYHAKHIQLVSASLHKVDDEHLEGEMLIVHELAGSGSEKPWSPVHDKIDTIIVSVMFKQSTNTGSFPAGSYSPIWEAMGFPRDKAVLRRTWLDTAASQGLMGWETNTLAGMLGSALGGNFYGYHGSLPVPPCWENVVYYVIQDPLPVSHYQVEGLLAVLAGHNPEKIDHNQRPAQREIGHEALNRVQVSGSALGSCDSLEEPWRQATAACWACPAGTVKSPVNILSATAKAAPLLTVQGRDKPHMKYHATTAFSERGTVSLNIRPAPFHDFGMLELGGRFYDAKQITVHAVGLHAIDNVRYDGEIHIHHYLYGDWFDAEHNTHGRRMDAFRGDTYTDEAVHGAPSFQVIVAIPLQVTTNPGGDFMDELLPHSLQSGEKAYASHNDLKKILAGDFFQYRGTPIYPACDTNVIHWIVHKEPLQVSASQLFTEYPTRSGFDTTPALVHHHDLEINKNHVTHESLGSGASCDAFDSHNWTYADTHCWARLFPNCAKRAQSPINIDTTKLVHQDAHLKETLLNFAKYHPVSHLRVTHKGHTLQVADKMNGNSHLGLGYIEVQGNFYFLRQFHIHFPSEHVIDGHQHSAELHLVHQKQDHWGHTAWNNHDILVVAIFFDIGPEESPLLKQLYMPGIEKEHNVKTGWAKTLKEPLDLMRALGPVLKGDYYRYTGSFTTPPCDEVVKWFVMKTSMSISQAQWTTFKALFPNPANARPVEPLNDRKVAVNTFQAPDQEYSPQKYEFYLDRFHGRNRDKPTPYVIMGGVLAAVIMTLGIFCATFIRQASVKVTGSAGGLVASAESVGRSSNYGRMNDRM